MNILVPFYLMLRIILFKAVPLIQLTDLDLWGKKSRILILIIAKNYKLVSFSAVVSCIARVSFSCNHSLCQTKAIRTLC